MTLRSLHDKMRAEFRADGTVSIDSANTFKNYLQEHQTVILQTDARLLLEIINVLEGTAWMEGNQDNE